MRRGVRLAGWLLAAIGVATLPTRVAPAGLAPRLLGPAAPLAASWQWVRVRQALGEGRPALAYARAELALELAPAATGGWSWLAGHYAFDRAAPDDEPDPELRTAWVRAALALLARGEARAAEPAVLAQDAALILVHVGEFEGRIPWPGGTPGAWREAEGHFERALELDPARAQAWIQLARHRVLRLASERCGVDAAGRVAAAREALALLERGEGVARDPAQLAFERGLLYAWLADGAEGALWAGGRPALYRAALDAFAQAEAGGEPHAHEAEAAARTALEACERAGAAER